MPYRICKIFEIENGHMLSKHPDDCRFPHGHTRKIEFILEADKLDDRNMVCDFKIISRMIHDFVMTFDHALCMNTADPAYPDMKAKFGDHVIGFKDEDPTTEVLARTFYDTFNERLSSHNDADASPYKLSTGVRLACVRVWETGSSWAEYGEE